MRALYLLPLLALAACLSDGPEGTGAPNDSTLVRASAPLDVCSTALTLQHEALDMAMTDPPKCVSDDDCVSFSLAVRCEDVLNIGDCPRAVHRVVAERYDAKAVNERICKAVRGAELGCSASPICAATGPAVCEAGECSNAPYER